MNRRQIRNMVVMAVGVGGAFALLGWIGYATGLLSRGLLVVWAIQGALITLVLVYSSWKQVRDAEVRRQINADVQAEKDEEARKRQAAAERRRRKRREK